MPAHLCAALIGLAESHGDRVTSVCDGRLTSAAELHDRVALLSGALSQELHLSPGDRVALLGHNTDAFFEALLAVLDAGCLACPLNWRWSPAELAAALELTRPELMLVDPACGQLAAAALAAAAGANAPPRQLLLLPPPRGGAAPPQSLPQLLAAAAAAAPSRPPPRLQLRQSGAAGLALVCFTSGTTGASKGAALSHSGLLHQSMAKLSAVGYGEGDVYLHLAPLFHIGGLSSALAVLLAHGRHVFLPRYCPRAALRLVRGHEVTALIAVPAIVQDLSAAAEAEAAAGAAGAGGALPSVRRVLVGAGAMTPALHEAAERLFPQAQLSTAYGMTEAASSITFVPLREQRRLQEAAGGAAGGVCVGRPAPGLAVRIDRSAAAGAAAAASGPPPQGRGAAAGEVLVAGPNLMAGYWAPPPPGGGGGSGGRHGAALAPGGALTADGWLRTGDLGRLDSGGRLWLLGRVKDMVKSGGENVFAAEVEAALASHAGVAAAAVVGLPHARLGEQVAAAVVLRPRWSWDDRGGAGASIHHQQQQRQEQQQQQQQQQLLSQAALQQHCRARGLSGYKLPRLVVPLAALPTNSSGKVVKALLREQLLAMQQQGRQQPWREGQQPRQQQQQQQSGGAVAAAAAARSRL